MSPVGNGQEAAAMVERVLGVRLDAVSQQIKEGFSAINTRLDKMDATQGQLEGRVRSLELSKERQGTKIALMMSFFSMLAAALASFLSRR